MVQPTLASFFKKPAAPASSNKRPLEEEGNATTTTKGEEGSADAATAQGKQKLGEEQDEQPRKKAAVEPSSSAPAATLTLSSLPEAVASHPVMQPVAGMDEGLRQVVLAEAGKPYFARLLQFLTQEANSKQVRACVRAWVRACALPHPLSSPPSLHTPRHENRRCTPRTRWCSTP